MKQILSTKTKTIHKKLKPLRPFLALPLILFMAFGLISIASRPESQRVDGVYGIYDLRRFDFENYIAETRGQLEYIPNALLTPDEFAAWDGDIQIGWVNHYQIYATSRMRIYVEDGKWYTFTRYSIDYAQRLYVNGEWLLDIGRPGATPEESIPNTGRITLTAQGMREESSSGDYVYVIEIVQQSSNHVHQSGGSHPWWYIGTGTTISDWVRAEQYQTNIILGSFLMLALLFFVLFFTHGQNKVTLYFAMFCITWFMRMGVTGGRVFTVILPWLDWHTKFRIEYIAIPISAVLTLAIVNVLFKDKNKKPILHKPVLFALYGISAVFAGMFIFLPTIIMRGILDYVLIVYGLAIAWLFVCLFIIQPVRQARSKHKIYSAEQGIFLSGMVLFLLAALTDFGYFQAIVYMPPFHLTGVAMLVFALCEAAAVFLSAMKDVEETRAVAQRKTEETEFFRKMSHNLRTPLTKVSTNIQTAKRRPEEAAELLEKSQAEIMNIAAMIDNALQDGDESEVRR